MALAFINAPTEEKEVCARRLAEALNQVVTVRPVVRAELVELLGTPIYEEGGLLHYAVLEKGASRLELVFVLRGGALRRATLGVADIHRGKDPDL
jgi:hypothetical protein